MKNEEQGPTRQSPVLTLVVMLGVGACAFYYFRAEVGWRELILAGVWVGCTAAFIPPLRRQLAGPDSGAAVVTFTLMVPPAFSLALFLEALLNSGSSYPWFDFWGGMVAANAASALFGVVSLIAFAVGGSKHRDALLAVGVAVLNAFMALFALFQLAPRA